MNRLTVTELNALGSASSFGPDFDSAALARQARQMRAEVLNELLGRGFRRLGAFLGLPAIAQRLSSQRLYRRTLSELSRLDDRCLNDIGLQRSGISGAAYEASGLAQARPGPLARLRQAALEARDRRRTAQDLGMLNRRLLLDIGVEPDGIEEFVAQARRYGGKPAPVIATATPALALDLLFPTQPLFGERAPRVTWDAPTTTPAANAAQTVPAKAANDRAKAA